MTDSKDLISTIKSVHPRALKRFETGAVLSLLEIASLTEHPVPEDFQLPAAYLTQDSVSRGPGYKPVSRHPIGRTPTGCELY